VTPFCRRHCAADETPFERSDQLFPVYVVVRALRYS